MCAWSTVQPGRRLRRCRSRGWRNRGRAAWGCARSATSISRLQCLVCEDAEITVDEAGNRSFYLYANDIQRGLDVFRFDEAAGTAPTDGGSWMTPAQYVAVKRSLDADSNGGG